MSQSIFSDEYDTITITEAEEKVLKDLNGLNWALIVLLGLGALVYYFLFDDLFVTILNIICMALLYVFNGNMQNLDPSGKTGLTVIYSLLLVSHLFSMFILGQVSGIIYLIFLARGLGTLLFNKDLKYLMDEVR
jgi:hypothetical protein